MKNKKILLTAAATVATLSLAACNTYTNRAGHIDGYRHHHRAGHIDGYRHHHRIGHMDGYNNHNRAVIDGNRTGRINNNHAVIDGNRAGRINNNRAVIDGNRAGRIDGNHASNGYNNRVGYNDASAGYGNSLDYNNDNRIGNRVGNRAGTDTHLNFVSNHGFQNVANANGTSHYRRYRLDSNNATNNDIFHSWRHAWVEPGDYMGKDIDLYRYNGNMNGQQRTIHILSHNGNPIGGYHYGRGETAEQGIMLNRDGFTSRGVNDFRGAWNGMFDIRG